MAFPPTLRYFGGASIEGPEGPLTGRATQRHRLALLALLAVESRGMSRDKLAALLWPEHPEDKARHALSDSVYRIGKELGDGALVSLGDRELRLEPDRVPSDVARFRSAIASEDWEAAAETYEGPFLDGFHLAGCPEFERWVEAQRLRFARDHARALEALAEHRAGEGDRKGAVAAWRRRAAADPYDSRVAARLMEALAAAGNPAAALLHGQEHADLLRREVGADPDPAIEAVAARIRRTPAADVPEAVVEVGAGPHRPISVPAPVEGSDFTAHDPHRGTDLGGRPDRGSRRRLNAGALLAMVLLVASAWIAWGPESAPGTEGRRAAGSEGPVAVDRSPAIAVLPFRDLTPDSDRAWLGDSLAEEIRLALGRIRDLHVLGAISSFRLRDPSLAPGAVAEAMGADFLVGGSVREGGDSIWVTAHLVDGPTGRQEWAHTYSAAASTAGMRSVQNRIADRIAETLSLRIGGESGAASLPAYAVYDKYLEGQYLLRRFQSGASTDDAELLTALGMFEDVVEEAPDWADGWAGLGETHHWVAYRRVGPEDHHWQEAERVLAQALRLDPDHPRANASMGYSIHRLYRDYESANAYFQKALEVDLGEYVHCGYALFLLWAGHYEQAMVATRRAEAHDPLYSVLAAFRATTSRCADRPEDAVRHARRVLSGTPRVATARRDLALALSRLGKTTEALGVLDDAEDGEAYYALVQALVLARAGREDEAGRILAEVDLAEARALTDRATSGQIKPTPVVAATLAALGRAEEAIVFLEEAMQEDPMVLLYDRCYPELQALEADPRYRQLLRRTGVPGV